MILPSDGSVSLEQLTAAVQEAHSRLGIPDTIEARSILLAENNTIAHAATTVRVGFERATVDRDEETRTVGPLVLITVRARASAIASPDVLRHFFVQWQRLTNTSGSFDPQFPAPIYRQPSLSEWDSGPSWMLNVHDRTPTQNRPGPYGPFYDARTGFFAESFGAAAFLWVGNPHVREMTVLSNQYFVVIRDQKAVLSQAIVQRCGTQANALLRVQLRSGLNTPPDTDLAIVTTDFDGNRTRAVKQLSGTNGEITIAYPFQTLQAIVFDRKTGDWLDRLHQGGYGRASLLDTPENVPEPKHKQLVDDLARGECDTVEFKPFIDLARRDPKPYEILKEVTAFANVLLTDRLSAPFGSFGRHHVYRRQ